MATRQAGLGACRQQWNEHDHESVGVECRRPDYIGGSSAAPHLRKSGLRLAFSRHNKNGLRKWCSMSDCGGRAKSKRYYESQKKLQKRGVRAAD
jgi:hypothetical protein